MWTITFDLKVMMCTSATPQPIEGPQIGGGSHHKSFFSHYHLEKMWKQYHMGKCENIIIWKMWKHYHLKNQKTTTSEFVLKTSSWNIGKHCHLKNKKAISSRKIGKHNHLEKCESNITWKKIKTKKHGQENMRINLTIIIILSLTCLLHYNHHHCLSHAVINNDNGDG